MAVQITSLDELKDYQETQQTFVLLIYEKDNSYIEQGLVKESESESWKVLKWKLTENHPITDKTPFIVPFVRGEQQPDIHSSDRNIVLSHLLKYIPRPRVYYTNIAPTQIIQSMEVRIGDQVTKTFYSCPNCQHVHLQYPDDCTKEQIWRELHS